MTKSEEFIKAYEDLCKKHGFQICQTYPTIEESPCEEEWYATFTAVPFHEKVQGIKVLSFERHQELVRDANEENKIVIEKMNAIWERNGGVFKENGEPDYEKGLKTLDIDGDLW